MRDKDGNRIKSKKVQNANDVRAWLRDRASELPPQYEDHKASTVLKGKEILAIPKLVSSLSKELLAQIEENPENKYNVPYTIGRKVDHFKRMLKLAKRNGPKAAAVYYDQVLKNTAQEMQPTNIGGIQTEIDYGSAIRNF